eukprot:CAMPEP_0170741264 /NCGR_PEP_ID=MMETSP0437-20130122/6126_1 /TAXON_ID=0 /ORGANISM="Sexangularia sp." /LENGTH=159 /DNA_ID=CAMNT_0011079823 /DNA_START=218 /DNA_END=697 /DNA_ORIENTATION=-
MTAKQLCVTVTDEIQNTLYSNGCTGAEGKFTFTTAHGGTYSFCFEDQWVSDGAAAAGMTTRWIDFRLATGVDAVDYSEVAKREHLEPIERELLKVEDSVKEVLSDFEYMRERESIHRDTTESTHSRVTFMSVLSYLSVIGLGAWQISHLRSFFKKSKLI